jgi:catechol 2,3-dioxygenase-like lactoylglutathione lyase family enzyme
MGVTPASPAAVVDLVPFILVADVERSIPFYEALGFEVVKRHEPHDRLEFAGLEATSSAKVMLARVDEVPATGPDASTPGFLYLYTSDLEGLRARLLDAGHQADEIADGPGPGPTRQMCVRDPDGHGHMVAELFEGSMGSSPPLDLEEMGKTWVLDTETKGTGANMVPLDKVQKKKNDDTARRRRTARQAAGDVPERERTQRSRKPVERTVTALPEGHVRKKATGEIGKVLSVDPKAGTAVVRWLKRGAASTVPLSAISRR